MRSAVVVGIALLLAGCQSSESRIVDACEWVISRTLVAPSTYERAELTVYEATATVIIHFDAANALGTRLRGHAICKHAVADFEPALDEDGFPTLIEATVNGEEWSDEELSLATIIYREQSR